MKVADSCMDTSVNIQLFVEILNEYLYYFETNPEVVRAPLYMTSTRIVSN